MIKNIIKNASEKTHFGADAGNTTYVHFTNLAKELEEKTGNKHIIERVLDYTDTYDGQPRFWYSFDLIELIS